MEINMVLTGLEFVGQGCGPCHRMAPIIKTLQKEGKKITVVDAGDSSELVDKWNVTGLPTLIILKGDKEVTRFVGVTDIDEIRKAFKDSTPDKNLDYILW
jgi:thioredoxin 1